ncbi:MAG: LysE family transporter [Bacillota bacterium]|jgi:threonine/homoserine/homoserine lactone efflux protein
MKLLPLFLTAFLVGLTGAMTPGPLLTVTISETARKGFLAAPALVLGHVLLELLLVLALLLGLSSLLSQSLFLVITGMVGGAALIWLGRRIILDASQIQLDLTPVEGKTSLWGPILTGAAVSISNPYWILWWATIGISYILLALQSGSQGLLFFLGGHFLADFSWYLLIGGLVAAGKKFISLRYYQWILRLSGFFLLALGGYFLLSSVQSVLS